MLAWGGVAWWNATRAWKQAAGRVEAEARIRFEDRTVDQQGPAGLESLGSPRAFRDAAVFQGLLYVCGPSGLIAFRGDGSLAARYRPGLELPPAPLARVATGRAGSDPQEQLWITTEGEGLLAFDGRRFRQIRPETPRMRKLTAILPLATGQILLGTAHDGVLVFDGTSLTSFHSSLADLAVTALAGDETEFWIGTLDRGVLHWRAGQAEAAGEAEGLPDRQVHALAARDGRAWAGTAMGVAELHGGRYKRLLAPGFFAQAILPRGGSLVVGTLEEGWLEVPLEGRTAVRQAARGCAGCPVMRLLELEGMVVAVTRDAVFAEGQEWTAAEPSMLADRDISALAIDTQGRLWVGYFDRGLEILAEASTSRRLEDDVLFCVNRIVHSASRSLVATANGLVTFDAQGARQSVLRRAEGLIASHVTDVALLDDGSIAAATPAGVSFIENGTVSSVYAFHGLVNNHAYTLGADGGRLLVGTLGGLSILNRGMVTASFTTANSGLKHNWITALTKVHDEWFAGTYGAGVLRLDTGGRWSAFPDLPSFEVNPNAMKTTPCCVYAGTLGKGLAVYRRDAGRWSFVTAGLPSLNVTAIEEHRGILYLGTDNGAVRLPETSLRP